MRRFFEQAVSFWSWLSMVLLLAALLLVLGYLVYRGGGVLGVKLLFGKVEPLDALLLRRQVFDGLFPAIAGTVSLVLLSVGLVVPAGLAAGIYMAEYCRGWTRRLLSISFDVLAGLPSIVVGWPVFLCR